MDWTNERYVRLYTRDTDDWIVLSWQAKALLPLMLRKVDRSGFLATRRGSTGVAAQTGLPLEVVNVGLPDLLRDGAVTECDDGYLMPNYIEAQEASMSDAQRAKASRERRRDRKQSHIVSEESRNVTVESRNGVKPSPQPVQPSEPTRPAISNSGELTTAQRLTIAANQATRAKFGEQTRTLLPGHAGTGELVRCVEEAGVPIDFAERSIARQAGKPRQPVKSMAYFREGILDDWAAHNANLAAGSAPRGSPFDRKASSETRPTNLASTPVNAKDDGVVCSRCRTKELYEKDGRLAPRHRPGRPRDEPVSLDNVRDEAVTRPPEPLNR